MSDHKKGILLKAYDFIIANKSFVITYVVLFALVSIIFESYPLVDINYLISLHNNVVYGSVFSHSLGYLLYDSFTSYLISKLILSFLLLFLFKDFVSILKDNQNKNANGILSYILNYDNIKNNFKTVFNLFLVNVSVIAIYLLIVIVFGSLVLYIGSFGYFITNIIVYVINILFIVSLAVAFFATFACKAIYLKENTSILGTFKLSLRLALHNKITIILIVGASIILTLITTLIISFIGLIIPQTILYIISSLLLSLVTLYINITLFFYVFQNIDEFKELENDESKEEVVVAEPINNNASDLEKEVINNQDNSEIQNEIKEELDNKGINEDITKNDKHV